MSTGRLCCAVVFGLLCGCCVDRTLAVDPKRAVIVADADGVREAAQELQLHLKLMTDIDVPIVRRVDGDAYAFVFDERLPVSDNDESCAWSVDAQKTVFRGNAYFAVVDYLENALGVRWPQGDAVCCEKSALIRPAARSGAWVPDILIRKIRHYNYGNGNVPFARRMRYGQHAAPVYGHAFTKFWRTYGRDHRDFFAMRKDGIRGPWSVRAEDLKGDVAVAMADRKSSYVAMCCTSTGLVAQIVANWRAEGCPAYINLCENDVPGRQSCQCLDCRALDVVPEQIDPKVEKHYADRYVYFANRVLAAARPYRADVRVSYYAYNATEAAPRRERPDPASVIGICPTTFTHEHIADYVGGWSEAGARNYFYRPNRHHYYNCPYLPLGCEKHFFEIMRYLLDKGCVGFDYDAKPARFGSFEWLDRYVLLHGMQDPTKSYDYWEDHYCQAYGAAKEDVKGYLRFWREEVWDKRLAPDMAVLVEKGKWYNFARGLLHNLGDYYRAEDLAAAEKFLVAAEARPLNDLQAVQLARLRMAHEHAKLQFEAVAHKSKVNTQKLVDFRRAHGYPLYTWAEQYFGDITGVEALLGPNPDKAKSRMD